MTDQEHAQKFGQAAKNLDKVAAQMEASFAPDLSASDVTGLYECVAMWRRVRELGAERAARYWRSMADALERGELPGVGKTN